MALSRNRPKAQPPSWRARRQLRIATRAERRLQAMAPILPPQSGSRRKEFSSPLTERWSEKEIA